MSDPAPAAASDRTARQQRGPSAGQVPDPRSASSPRRTPDPRPPVPPPADTAVGRLELRPLRGEADLRLVAGWMNDPEVDRFWRLAGPTARTAAHLRDQYAAGHSLPLIGVLDGEPMSYWELYRADLDPLAAHYPAQPFDLGLHLLLGPAGSRGRGLAAPLIAAVGDGALAAVPDCRRLLAEPDERNLRSVAAFTRAGHRRTATLQLPDKTAALMTRHRTPPEGCP